MTLLPKAVRIVEVGPRDGLQNEATVIPTATKQQFIAMLAEAGLQHIEATAFVHPERVPQLADADTLAATLPHHTSVCYSALVPNRRGLARAQQAGIKHIAVFTAASDTFTQRNINMSVAESLATFAPLVEQAQAHGMTVRGYVSTGFVCPYEGDIAPARVVEVTQALLAMGIQEVSIGDTIGAASPRDVTRLLDTLFTAGVSAGSLALHMHDTYGTALANVYAGLLMGITTFDTSAGGLGGCPYAPGASGNLATEDLVYCLHRMGIKTGVDLNAVAAASTLIAKALGRRTLPSKQWQRLQAVQSLSPPPSCS